MYKLLIVDDEPLTREYMKINIPLLDNNWIVSGEASDGFEALEFLKNQIVDLIITDIRMPVMNGLELCKEVSNRFPRQKIIILSGYDEFSYAKEAILYGVSEYLLKPIVKDNLKSALANIRLKLEEEKKFENTYRNLLNLSRDSKDKVIKKFLQSLIYEAETEIKTLYPLIYRMKETLLEGEGFILVLTVDEDTLFIKDLPISDISIYRYILNQTITEMVEGIKLGRVFLDNNENTCILISGEDIQRVYNSSLELIAGIYSFMYENTGLTISASLGAPVNDLLKLHSSYKSADKLLTARLLRPGKQTYTYRDHDISMLLKHIDDISICLAKIKSSYLDGNEANYMVSLSNFLDQIDFNNIQVIIRAGFFIIKSLSKLKTDCNSELIENSMKLLRDFSINYKPGLSKDIIIKLYKEIMKVLSGMPVNEENSASGENRLNEQKIIAETKEYIHLHYSEPISLGLIAENVGISSSYLSQLFHKTVGESYIQFLTRVRMEQAAKLLKEYPNEKLSNICEKVGYMGVKHFSYVFKQFFSITPGEYQNKR